MKTSLSGPLEQLRQAGELTIAGLLGCRFLAKVLCALVLCTAFCQIGSAQTPQQIGQPAPLVIPASIDVGTNNITIGSTVYAPSGNPGMHIVALDRGTLQLLGNETFTSGDATNQFLNSILSGNHADAVILLNGVGNYGFGLNAIAANLAKFGAQQDITKVTDPIPFNFVGNGGLQIGQGYQTGFSGLHISGYFARDSHSKYIFFRPDYVRYSILTDGTINVGDKTYPASATSQGCGSPSGVYNGYHVVVVQRDDPSQLISDTRYCAGDLVDDKFLIAHLTLLAQSESNLVFVVSAGHKYGDESSPGKIGQALHQLGGYSQTIPWAGDSGTYSLVGTAAPPAGTRGAPIRSWEASSIYPGHPSGELHGVLGRGHRGNWYSPINADLAGRANLGLYDILTLSPVPFPHPDTAAELTTFHYIGNALCGSQTCNVRDAYWNTAIDIGVWLTQLNALKDPESNQDTCATPTATPFCVVKSQLQQEFAYVALIRDFNRNIDDVWQGSASVSILSLLNTYQSIRNQIDASDTAPAQNVLFIIANTYLAVASYTPVPAAPLFGIADVFLNLGNSLITNADGTPMDSLNTTVANVEQQARNSFIQQATATGTVFDFIYQDWAKVQALGKALASQDPAWTWNGSSTTGQVLQAFAPSIEQGYYRSLMPAEFAIGSYVPPDFQRPSSYVSCIATYVDILGHEFYLPQHPFQSSYATYTDPSDPHLDPDPGTQTLRGYDGVWRGISRRDTPAYTLPDSFGNYPQYSPPVSSFMAHLFLPISQGGLGVYRPDFFEGWAFPSAYCSPSIMDRAYAGGCAWNSATPPVDLLPPALTKIGISAQNASRNGTQVDVPLTITNTGSVQADNIQFGQIALRTLAGSGTATLIDPIAPYPVGTLGLGSSTTVTLHLMVPAGITKLSITESGTLETSASDSPYQFSLGQVVVP